MVKPNAKNKQNHKRQYYKPGFAEEAFPMAPSQNTFNSVMQRSQEQTKYLQGLQPSFENSEHMQANYNSLMYSKLDAHQTGQRKVIPIFPIGLTSNKASHQITVDGFGGKSASRLTFLD